MGRVSRWHWGLFAWILVSCGGIADAPPSSTANEVGSKPTNGGPATASDEAAPADMAPAAGGQASEDEPVEAMGGHPVEYAPDDGEPAGGVSSEPTERVHGCEDVCATLADCAGEALSECNERCEQSTWVETHQVRCLALRVYWIDEEGCSVMLETYENFEPADDCAD